MQQRNSRRISCPLQPVYDPHGFQLLIEEDVSLLPALLLDALHVLVIKFAVFFIGSNPSKEFSDCDPGQQIALFSRFQGRATYRSLNLPRRFKEMKGRLYKKWNKMFEDENVVQQIWCRSQAADIILLQRVKEGTFQELTKLFSKMYSIVPNRFPTGQTETTVICLLKATVDLQESKTIRRIDNRHFAVSCNSGNVLYYVGVVCFEKSESSSVKKKVVNKLIPSIGNTPVIFGGEFGEDLAVSHNPVPRAVLNKYNGIHYEDKAPLRSILRRTRTYLNFQTGIEGKACSPVTGGIFSSLPLVESTFCDDNEWENNPSDHAPIFQEIMLGSF